MKKILTITLLILIFNDTYSQLIVGANINYITTTKDYNNLNKTKFQPLGLYFGYDFHKFTFNTMFLINDFLLTDNSTIENYNIPLVFNTKFYHSDFPICFNTGFVINSIFVNHYDKEFRTITKKQIFGPGVNLSMSSKINNRRFEIGSIFTYDLTDNYDYRYYLYVSIQLLLFNRIN